MMGLKSSRKILSAFLTAVIALSLCVICFDIAGIITKDSRSFYSDGMSDSRVAAECEKQLSAKYEALSVKTNIPSDIFKSVTKKYNTAESLRLAAGYLFDENDSKLKNDARQQYFVDTCKEYFHANNIRYDENSLELACKEASDIYSDTVGIHNLDYLNESTVRDKINRTKRMSFFVVFAVCSVICLCLLYKNKLVNRLLYVSCALFSSSAGCFLYSALNLIIKPYSKDIAGIEPYIFSQAFISMMNKYNYYIMLFAVALFLSAAILLIFYIKRSKKEQFRKEVRFEKIIHKL